MKPEVAPGLNLANLITISRFLLAAILALLLMLPPSNSVGLIAFVVFAIAAISDWLDGYIARKYNLVTDFGKLMDPLADKVLVLTALIMLIPLGRIPAWIALLIIVREVVVTGLRGIASQKGVAVAASKTGKVKSTLQYIGLGVLIFPASLLPFIPLHQMGSFIIYIATVITVWSGIDYFYKLKKFL